MKHLLRTFAFLLLKITQDKIEPTGLYCKIVNDGKFMQLTMPNGEVIPGQTNMIVLQDLKDKYVCKVQITTLVSLDNIVIK